MKIFNVIGMLSFDFKKQNHNIEAGRLIFTQLFFLKKVENHNVLHFPLHTRRSDPRFSDHHIEISRQKNRLLSSIDVLNFKYFVTHNQKEAEEKKHRVEWDSHGLRSVSLLILLDLT